MRDSFPGYYRPSADEFDQLWKSALVVPDANVLLTLYRLGDSTQERLLKIFTEMKERLFLSYQAGYEFQKNRLAVIEEQEATYDTVKEKIADFPNALGRELRQHPRLDRRDLEARLGSALKPVRDYVEEVQAQHPDPLSEDAIGTDAVRDILDDLFAGKVGPERDLHELADEGSDRYERKVPPGYEDAGKEEPDRYGDLAIWLDILGAAKMKSKDVILVTAERKEDWWWVHKGKRIGARPELIAEMREKAEQSVYLYDIKRFMEEASAALELGEFSEDERKDVARAQKASSSHLTTYFGNLNWGDIKLPEGFHWTELKTDPKAIERLASVDPSTLSSFNTWARGMRWQSSAQVEDGAATLSLRLQPELVVPSVWHEGRRISCIVTGPEGGQSQAVAIDSPFRTSFKYPEDFTGETETAEGSYDYEWLMVGGTQIARVPSGSVASGGFELPASKPDAAQEEHSGSS